MKKEILKSSIRNTIDGILIFLLFITTTVYALPSNGVIYDNTNSGSSATNVNDALDDLYTKVNAKQTEIDRINGIGDAGSNHILSGKTAYVKGQTITGTIPSKGAATYTPGTSNQTIASGNYLSGNQTIKGDANLVAGNIKAGSSIFGVNGAYTSDANAVAGNILSGKTAYVNGNKITGSMPLRNGSSEAPTVSTGTSGLYMVFPHGYYPAENHFNNANSSEVFISNAKVASAIGLTTNKLAKGQNVLGVAGTYTSDANAAAGNILSGKTAYVNGNKITGTIPSKGAATYTPGTSNQTIASGNYLSGVQTIKGDANLVAGNIKKGVSIFGVSGTYDGNGAISTLESNGWGNSARASGLAYVYSAKVGSTISISGTFSSIVGVYSRGCTSYYEIDGKGWGNKIAITDNAVSVSDSSASGRTITCPVKANKPGVGLISLGYRNQEGSDTANWHWNYALVVVYP